MYDPQIFERYLKVRALAEQGTDGEKINAARFQRGLEEKNPWLLTAYAQYRAQSATPPPQPSAAPPPRPPPPPGRGSTPEEVRDWNSKWSSIFGFAQDAFHRARDFVDAINDAATGYNLADGLSVTTKNTRTGNLVVSATLKEADLDELDTFNAMQRVAFRDRTLARLREQLDMILGLDEGDDEDA